MASIPVGQPPPPQPVETVEQRFLRLASIWDRETRYLSSMSEAFSHPAYLEIINLGTEVVPFLLRDMEANHTHWFGALRAITGANPLSASVGGNVSKIVEAWLRWAKDSKDYSISPTATPTLL